MLYDKAKIYVEGGRGGDGCVSFRREARVPKGGPDGGDGGGGGKVVLVADSAMKDLSAFRHKRHFKAGKGGNGSGSQKHGRAGPTLEVKVAVGTVATDLEAGDVYDLSKPGERVLVAAGGSGGRGNKRFAGPTRQAPRLAEKGTKSESAWFELKLKLLADVGLIGKPNAGKSSILGRLTRARPKVADYPFTTVEPVLGTAELGYRQLIVADIPGLIEGAAEGAGLGHEFLAHVERTKLLVHVVEVMPIDESDPKRNYMDVESELEQYDRRLSELPRVIALNKIDLVSEKESKGLVSDWQAELGKEIPVIPTSSVSGLGIDRLKEMVFDLVPDEAGTDTATTTGEPAEYRVYRPAEKYAVRVSREGPGAFHVSGRRVEQLVERADLESQEALEHLERSLERLGVMEKLESEGFKPGDEIRIGSETFELWI